MPLDYLLVNSVRLNKSLSKGLSVLDSFSSRSVRHSVTYFFHEKTGYLKKVKILAAV